jgi:hypothetical protein
MAPPRPMILRTIWPSNIVRILVLYYIYRFLEGLLVLLHDSSVINLGPFYTLFILRQDFAISVYNEAYLPLSPIANGVLWGIAAKPLRHATQNPTSPTSERFAPHIVGVATLAIWGYWLRTACYCSTGYRSEYVWREADYCTPKHSAAVFVFARPCIEALCGVGLSIMLTLASWRGWAWDFGIWDEVSGEDDNLVVGKLKRELYDREVKRKEGQEVWEG